MTTLMSVALPASATAHIHPPADTTRGLPSGLTDADAARISAAIAAARTESTRHFSALVWNQWERWCAERDIPALPGDPLALCAYLTERALAVRAMGTSTCPAPRSDTSTAYVVSRTRGVRRRPPSAARPPADVRSRTASPRPPLTVDEIRLIVADIDRTTPIGIRDAAMIPLGYASSMRRAEIVALTLADVEHKPAGLLLHVRRSKMDQDGHGQVVAVAHGQHALTDPGAAVAAWRTVRGEEPGALFTRIWASSVSLEPLSGHVVARMLRARPKPQGSTASGSLPTPCAPDTRPPRRSPASRSTGSPPRRGTRTSPSSSTATSGPWRHLRRHRARSWDCRADQTPGSEHRWRATTMSHLRAARQTRLLDDSRCCVRADRVRSGGPVPTAPERVGVATACLPGLCLSGDMP
jgi:integrase